MGKYKSILLEWTQMLGVLKERKRQGEEFIGVNLTISILEKYLMALEQIEELELELEGYKDM